MTKKTKPIQIVEPNFHHSDACDGRTIYKRENDLISLWVWQNIHYDGKMGTSAFCIWHRPTGQYLSVSVSPKLLRNMAKHLIIAADKLKDFRKKQVIVGKERSNELS